MKRNKNTNLFNKKKDSEQSLKENSTLGDANLITNEDGVGLEEDFNKLNGMNGVINKKMSDKNNKISDDG
jgi:hypothetical protein